MESSVVKIVYVFRPLPIQRLFHFFYRCLCHWPQDWSNKWICVWMGELRRGGGVNWYLPLPLCVLLMCMEVAIVTLNFLQELEKSGRPSKSTCECNQNYYPTKMHRCTLGYDAIHDTFEIGEKHMAKWSHAITINTNFHSLFLNCSLTYMISFWKVMNIWWWKHNFFRFHILFVSYNEARVLTLAIPYINERSLNCNFDCLPLHIFISL